MVIESPVDLISHETGEQYTVFDGVPIDRSLREVEGSVSYGVPLEPHVVVVDQLTLTGPDVQKGHTDGMAEYVQTEELRLLYLHGNTDNSGMWVPLSQNIPRGVTIPGIVADYESQTSGKRIQAVIACRGIGRASFPELDDEPTFETYIGSGIDDNSRLRVQQGNAHINPLRRNVATNRLTVGVNIGRAERTNWEEWARHHTERDETSIQIEGFDSKYVRMRLTKLGSHILARSDDGVIRLR